MENQQSKSKWLRYLLIFAGGFALCFFLLRHCVPSDNTVDKLPKATRTIVTKHDTVWPDTAAIWALKPTVKEPARVTHAPFKDTSNLCQYTRTYIDSLRDSNLVWYYEDSVRGEMLGKKSHYRLLIPQKILTTTTITDSIPYPVNVNRGGLYGGMEAGGGPNKFNLSPQVEWVSKKKWTAGYRYGIIDKTHNVSFKWKLFSQ